MVLSVIPVRSKIHPNVKDTQLEIIRTKIAIYDVVKLKEQFICVIIRND